MIRPTGPLLGLGPGPRPSVKKRCSASWSGFGWRSARQAKGKARLNAHEQLLNEDSAQKQDQVEIYIPPGPRLGAIVVEARGVRKAYPTAISS
jgi:hypothetical protein